MASRDQKFQAAFKRYMNVMFEHFSGDEEMEEEYQWKITAMTENKRTSIHQYELQLQTRYQIGETTVRTQNTITGEWSEPGPIYANYRGIPTPEQLKQHMNNTFDRYAVYHTQYMEERLAFVELNTVMTMEDDLAIYGVISVVYYLGKFPYPVRLTRMQYLREKCVGLQVENSKRFADIVKLKKMVYTRNLSILNQQERAQVTIREMYAKLLVYHQGGGSGGGSEVVKLSTENIVVDCPVCLNSIESADNLMVPACCHIICTDCEARCTKCPICREVFVKTSTVALDNVPLLVDNNPAQDQIPLPDNNNNPIPLPVPILDDPIDEDVMDLIFGEDSNH